MNLETAIYEAIKELKKKKIKSFILDCELLMSKAVNNSREFVILNSKKKIKKNNYNHFKELVYERSKGKPIAYITGKKYFWKYEFEINKDVLIKGYHYKIDSIVGKDIAKKTIFLNLLF